MITTSPDLFSMYRHLRVIDDKTTESGGSFATVEEAIAECILEARQAGESVPIHVHAEDCTVGYTGLCECEPVVINYDPEVLSS